MDLEELKRSAESGDIQALTKLVNYYGAKETFDYNEALKWAEKGAEQGNTYLTEKAMWFKMMDARAGEMVGVSPESVSEAWTKALEYGYHVLLDNNYWNVVLAQLGQEGYNQHRNNLINALCDATYSAGFNLWRAKDYTDVLAILDDVHPDNTVGTIYKKAQVLVGISVFSLASHSPNPAAEKTLWDKCLKALDVVDVSSNYIPKSRDEQIAFLVAVLDLSALYRLGGVVYQSTEHAHYIIERAIDKVTEQDIKEDLLKELSHYRKRLLGGYSYST